METYGLFLVADVHQEMFFGKGPITNLHSVGVLFVDARMGPDPESSSTQVYSVFKSNISH